MTVESDAEQFLADLEAKAKAATPGPWVMAGAYPIYSIGRGGLKDKTIGHAQRQWDGDFIAAANPAAVLRLVAMVRWLADVLHNSTGIINDKKYDVSKAPWLITAYNATEARHD